jgi:hypothetical protein
MTEETLPEPGEKTKAAVADARSRVEGRRKRVRMTGKLKDGTLISSAAHADVHGNRAQFLDAFGTCSDEFAQLQCRQLVEVCIEKAALSEDDVNGFLAMVDAVRPDNELEAA